MAQVIRDVMTKNPVCISADQPVFEAAKKMMEANVGDIIVEENGKPRGILTDRDIVVRAVAEHRDPDSTKIGEICSKDIVSVKSDDAIDRAVELMRDKAIRRVPVIDGGKVVGIVSLGDLAVEPDPKSALGQISSASPNR